MQKHKTLIDIGDGSKKIRPGAEYDLRTGNANIASIFGLRPYEKGYCCLAVMSTPKLMRLSNKEGDNRKELLDSFVDILELEFRGLSGIEDQILETNDISNNILNTSLTVKNTRNINTTIDMTFTEKTATPITKFMDMYTKYTYDPYTQIKTYGGRLNTNAKYLADSNANHMTKSLENECFNLLYMVTDNTGFLLEKAFILWHAKPLNTPFSTVYNMDKLEIERVDINLQWTCQVIDGKAANRLGSIYMRKLMYYAIGTGLISEDVLPFDYTSTVYTSQDGNPIPLDISKKWSAIS